jgi:hypothetical protein
MDQKQIKESYKRFKRWQQSPTDYEFASDEVQHCQNCGHDFTGNYCPYCSQKAGEGQISWRSVRQSFMDIWGLGTRSLPRSIAHLFLRPGHLISDYISGKRQVSFPPVKMLFFVAVIIVLLDFYLMPYLFDHFDLFGGYGKAYVGFDNMFRGHFAWSYFIMALLGIFPTWLLFRYAPRHTRHTLPQGFFIQVFLCVLNLVLSFVILLPLLLIDYSVYLYVSWALLIFYFVIAYKRLFGYGIWGTLWRVLILCGVVVLVLEALLRFVFVIDYSQLDPNQTAPDYNRFYDVGHILAQGLVLLGAGWVMNLIANKFTQVKTKHQNKKPANE